MAGVKFTKKNDSIEIRLPDKMKTAFQDKCRQEGRTASDAVRAFIGEQIEPRGDARRRSLWRIGAAAAVGAVLGGGLAAPSIASAGGSRSAFQDLDRDRDGRLTYEEFRSR